MIGNGAVLGYLPYHIRRMSLWDYSAALIGYNKSVDPKGSEKAPSVDKLNAQIAESMKRDARRAAKKAEESQGDSSPTSDIMSVFAENR